MGGHAAPTRPSKGSFGLVCSKIGKRWLAFSHYCRPVHTFGLFDFFLLNDIDSLTNNRGPTCYLQVPRLAPLQGLAGMAWHGIFDLLSLDPANVEVKEENTSVPTINRCENVIIPTVSEKQKMNALSSMEQYYSFCQI